MGPPTFSPGRVLQAAKLRKADQIYSIPRWCELSEPAPEPSSGISKELPQMDVRTADVLKNAAAAVQKAKEFRKQSRERRSRSNAPSDFNQPAAHEGRASVHPQQLSGAYAQKPQSLNPSRDSQARRRYPSEDARDCHNRMLQRPPLNPGAQLPSARHSIGPMPMAKCSSQIHNEVLHCSPAAPCYNDLDRCPLRALRTSKLPQPPTSVERRFSAPSFDAADKAVEAVGDSPRLRCHAKQDTFLNGRAPSPSSNRMCDIASRNAPSPSPPQILSARDRSSSQKFRSSKPVQSSTPRFSLRGIATPRTSGSEKPARSSTPRFAERQAGTPSAQVSSKSARSSTPRFPDPGAEAPPTPAWCSPRNSDPLAQDGGRLRESANPRAHASRSNSPASADRAAYGIPMRQKSLLSRCPSDGGDCQETSPRFTPRRLHSSRDSPRCCTPQAPSLRIHPPCAHSLDNKCQPSSSATPVVPPPLLSRFAPTRADDKDAVPPPPVSRFAPSRAADNDESPRMMPRHEQLIENPPRSSTPRMRVDSKPSSNIHRSNSCKHSDFMPRSDSCTLKWLEEVLRSQPNSTPMVLNRLALRTLSRADGYDMVQHEDIRFMETIGKGSFGAVWRAQFQGKEVAVKQCIVGDAHDTNMLLEEIRCLQSLRHARLVSYLGCCNKAPHVLMVMEYMAGGSLHNLLFKKKQRLEFSEKARMAYEIAEGLAYVHGLGVVHRDLKTANIVLDDKLSCKLCDFGLTLMLEQSHVTVQKLEGSPRYMAPEQFQPKARITEKCDIWQFGCVMLELFCLATPFAHCKGLQQIVTELLVRKRSPSAPAEADPRARLFVQASLRMSPAARPAASALKRALCGAWKERALAEEMGLQGNV